MKKSKPGLKMKITIRAIATPRNPELEKTATTAMAEAIEKIRQVWEIALRAAKETKP